MRLRRRGVRRKAFALNTRPVAKRFPGSPGEPLEPAGSEERAGHRGDETSANASRERALASEARSGRGGRVDERARAGREPRTTRWIFALLCSRLRAGKPVARI